MQISAGDWYVAVLRRLFMPCSKWWNANFSILFRLVTVFSLARDISRDFQLYIFSCFYHSNRNLKTIIKQNEGYLKRSSVYNGVRDTGLEGSTFFPISWTWVCPRMACKSRLGHPTSDHKMIMMPHSCISHEVFLFVCLRFKISCHSARCTTDISVSVTIPQRVQWSRVLSRKLVSIRYRGKRFVSYP